MTTIVAKDLTIDFPRSPLQELEGLPWLARLIDKVRALQAGKIGEYTPYPCGGDRSFLAATGVDADQLKGLIDGGADDAVIARWVKANWAPCAEERLDAYRESMLAPVQGEYLTYLEGAVAKLKAARPDLDTAKIDNFTRLICVEEGHACPGI